MKSIHIEYPDFIPTLLNQSPESFEEDAKMALAVKLYEMGRLTSGQAASLIGIPRAKFLLNCYRYGATSVKWDRDELNAEFEK